MIILLQSIVQVGVGPVPCRFAERGANSSVGKSHGHPSSPIRRESPGRSRGSEEPSGRSHISICAEHGVDQVSVPVAAIMAMVGNHVPGEDVHPEWLAFFGRAIDQSTQRVDTVMD
jgi:hypothetical protein